MPTEEDLDWMCLAVQRHTKGFGEWWREIDHNSSGGRDMIAAILSVWEAGRIKAHVVPEHMRETVNRLVQDEPDRIGR